MVLLAKLSGNMLKNITRLEPPLTDKSTKPLLKESLLDYSLNPKELQEGSSWLLKVPLLPLLPLLRNLEKRNPRKLRRLELKKLPLNPKLPSQRLLLRNPRLLRLPNQRKLPLRKPPKSLNPKLLNQRLLSPNLLENPKLLLNLLLPTKSLSLNQFPF